MKFKKTIAALLAGLMMVSAIPAVSAAEENETDPVTETVTEEPVTTEEPTDTEEPVRTTPRVSPLNGRRPKARQNMLYTQRRLRAHSRRSRSLTRQRQATPILR